MSKKNRKWHFILIIHCKSVQKSQQKPIYGQKSVKVIVILAIIKIKIGFYYWLNNITTKLRTNNIFLKEYGNMTNQEAHKKKQNQIFKSKNESFYRNILQKNKKVQITSPLQQLVPKRWITFINRHIIIEHRNMEKNNRSWTLNITVKKIHSDSW